MDPTGVLDGLVRSKLGSQRFTKRQRLRKSHEFGRVQRQGKRESGRALVVVGAPNELGHDRLGLAVGKKVGGSVVRNRIKRWIREVFRRLTNARTTGWDFVVIGRPAAAEVTYGHVADELARLIGRLTQEKR